MTYNEKRVLPLADAMLAAVAAWLREEAATRRTLASEKDLRPRTHSASDWHARCMIEARGFDDLADVINPQGGAAS